MVEGEVEEGEEGAGEEGEEGVGKQASCTLPHEWTRSHLRRLLSENEVIAIDEPDGDESGQAVPISERITTPYMTKYERARVLGTRALQIRWVAY